MKLRTGAVFCLLAVLLAARLLDVHFHLPPKTAGETVHAVVLTLIETHQHGAEPGHGHLAGHLYEGETDETQDDGLLAKTSLLTVLLLPLLLGFLLRAWRAGSALRLPARANESPPRPRRWAYLAPPSQAPPPHV